MQHSQQRLNTACHLLRGSQELHASKLVDVIVSQKEK